MVTFAPVCPEPNTSENICDAPEVSVMPAPGVASVRVGRMSEVGKFGVARKVAVLSIGTGGNAFTGPSTTVETVMP